jgi:predicted DNA binding CopG/RHH family protein
MKKRLPDFKSDEEIENFLEHTDMSAYLNKDNLIHKNFEFLPKDKKVSMRFADNFLNLVKTVADKQGISYQKYIRMAVEEKIQQDLSR